MAFQLRARMVIEIKTYTIAMKGVTSEAALAILLTPPTITSPRMNARTSPETNGLTPNEFNAAADRPFAWTVGRRSPVAMIVTTANRMAIQRALSPFSMYVAGPPL